MVNRTHRNGCSTGDSSTSLALSYSNTTRVTNGSYLIIFSQRVESNVEVF